MWSARRHFPYKSKLLNTLCYDWYCDVTIWMRRPVDIRGNKLKFIHIFKASSITNKQPQVLPVPTAKTRISQQNLCNVNTCAKVHFWSCHMSATLWGFFVTFLSKRSAMQRSLRMAQRTIRRNRRYRTPALSQWWH